MSIALINITHAILLGLVQFWGHFNFFVSLHKSRGELTLGHPFILLKYFQNVHGLIYAIWQFNSISIYLYAKTLVKDPIVGHKNH